MKTEQHSFEISLDNNLFLRGNIHVSNDLSAGEKPVVIICHGFKGHKDWGFFPYAADYLASRGFCAIRFNFSCNGVKEKDFDELDKFAVNTFSREIDDLAVLLQYIKMKQLPAAHQFDIQRISMIGHSRGGGSSILFAAEEPDIKAIVTWNGIWNVDFLGDEVKNEIQEKGIAYIQNARTKQRMPIKDDFLKDLQTNRKRFDILNHLTHLKTPVLIIQGDEDRDWLIEGSKKMEDSSPLHHRIPIPKANHTFQTVHPFQGTTPELKKALEETIDFFKKHL